MLRAELGVKVTVIVEALYVIVPLRGVCRVPSFTKKLALVRVEASIAILNVALTVVEVETLVAPSTGLVLTTTGHEEVHVSNCVYV